MNRVFTSFDQLPLSLSAEDIAQVLGISRAGAYNLLNSQDFPTIRIGKRMVVRKEAFLAWIEKQEAA